METFNYVKINSVNCLCLIVNKEKRYIEESNGNNYLTQTSHGKYKETLKNIQKSETEVRA